MAARPSVGQLPPTLLCVDFGSTFTKATLVDTRHGTALGTAQHRTTIPDDTGVGDVLDGLGACRDELAQTWPEAATAPALACSSAGGGLRIAVVGNEELVTAEAGRRVALSSGGRVVAVLAGGLDAARFAELRSAEPDVILLVGGTDGGNPETLLADAACLSAASWSGPVVVAGDVEAQGAVAELLASSRTPYLLADNVVPRIGALKPAAARVAIRQVFLDHVIGGKHLSASEEFAEMVLGPTPDVVLLGVEALAAQHASTAPGAGVLVVDIGGATTDVHSVVVLDPETSQLGRDVVATTAVTRTVEGDLGMRWSAETTAAAAIEAALDLGAPTAELIAAARRRAEDPGLLAADAGELDLDRALATAAVLLAIRRHAGRSRVVLGPQGRIVERSGTDVRAVDLLVGSGGVLRSVPEAAARAVLTSATGPDKGGWQLPTSPDIVVDRTQTLAAAGLLLLYGERTGAVAEATEVAHNLICTSVIGTGHGRSRG